MTSKQANIALLLLCLASLSLCDQIVSNTVWSDYCCSKCSERNVLPNPYAGDIFKGKIGELAANGTTDISSLIRQLSKMPEYYTTEMTSLLHDFELMTKLGVYGCSANPADDQISYQQLERPIFEALLLSLKEVVQKNAAGYSPRFLEDYLQFIQNFIDSVLTGFDDLSDQDKAIASSAASMFVSINMQAADADTRNEFMTVSVDNACEQLTDNPDCLTIRNYLFQLSGKGYNPFAGWQRQYWNGYWCSAKHNQPLSEKDLIYYSMYQFFNPERSAMGYMKKFLLLYLGPGAFTFSKIPLPPPTSSGSSSTAVQVDRVPNAVYANGETETRIWARLTAMFTGPHLYCQYPTFYQTLLQSCPNSCKKTC